MRNYCNGNSLDGQCGVKKCPIRVNGSCGKIKSRGMCDHCAHRNDMCNKKTQEVVTCSAFSYDNYSLFKDFDKIVSEMKVKE